MSFTDNPLYSQQWHFNLIGDIETIWAEYSGDGVVVAVYDDGVQQNHADLDGNYDENLELPYDNGDPNGSGDGHGTACAGIIAAENNNEGGIGVAWGATITGVDYLVDIQSAGSAQMLQALGDMANYDVVSNSWGTFGFGYQQNSSFADILNPNSFTYAEANALGGVAATGRGGLGTIMVKAAGNDAGSGVQYGVTGHPSSQNDGLNVVRQIITVAATESDGFTSEYSNWGVNLLIAAPAAAVTTDLLGTGSGYDWTGSGSDDYTNAFGGTSAATPVVSGVVALMLEANPNLGWRDVQQILALSASHTGSSFGSGAAGFEDGSWFANGASNWNGGGLSYHINYGYGMVDAFAAVRMAEMWSEFFDNPQVSGNEVTSVHTSATTNQTIDGSSIIYDEIEVAANDAISIETIYVYVDATHSYMGDLTITLIAPDGTEFVLNENNGSGADLFGYTFAVNAAIGMSSEGIWTLQIEDTFPSADDGTLNDFELTFFGSDFTDDDVYHFTDDFADYEAVDSDRGYISDNNGGTDWLNFVAVTQDVWVDLRTFNTIYFGAASVAQVVTPGAFENIATGDGDDIIDGNLLGNHIITGRGDDRIYAYDGEDILEGGAGNDSLWGGADSDHFIYSSGADIIEDFTSEDLVLIDPAIWGGSIASLLAGASVVNGNVVLNFSAGNSLTFTGISNVSALEGYIYFEGQAPATPNAITVDISAAGQAAGLALQDIEGALSDLVMEAEIQSGQSSTGFTSISVGDGQTIVYTVTGTGLTYGTDAFGTYLNGGTVTNVNVTINGTFVGSFSGTIDAAQLSAAAFAELGGSLGALEAFFSAVNWTYNGSSNEDIIPEGFLSEDGVPFAFNGTDSLTLGGGNDSVFLAGGDDFANGGDGDDSIGGGDGNDMLEGGTGTDTLEGGTGSDTLNATGGNGNLLRGGTGDDVLIGGWGSDILQGNDGADSFSGGTGADDL
ncbi:S8 family serine peptidase, partial [[Roseibacterium] beibuensis]